MSSETLKSTGERQTKYATVVYGALTILKHATNTQILELVRQTYPEVSATTVHRVTRRLKLRNKISCAPKTNDGSERYDVNPAPHHHFVCANCNGVCDIADTERSRQIIGELKDLSTECAIVGTLVLKGICKKCGGKNEP